MNDRIAIVSSTHPKALPSQKELREKFQYNPVTGIFLRTPRKGMKRCFIGKPVGSLTDKGYLIISICRVRYLAHRLAWKYMTGEDPEWIDHKNQVKNDNRFENLRDVDRSVNHHNRPWRRRVDLPRGVYYHTLRKTKIFMAIIRHNGKKQHLGCFETAEEASNAFKHRAKQIYGENYSLEP